MRRWLLIACGVVAAALGIVGMFIPLLPTTPFVLLAAACFARSSDTLYQRLIGNRLLGGYLKSYREQRAIPLHAKIVVLVMLWAAIGYAVLGAVAAWPLQIALALIATGVTIHVLKLRTLKTHPA